MQTFEEYLDVLQASSDEFAALFNTILINVTAFFRDPDAWEFIASDVIPATAGRARSRRPDPGLERGLRLRPGGLHAGHAVGRGAGSRSVPATGQDLRHRHRRGGAHRGPRRRPTTRRPSSRCQQTCWSGTSSRSTAATLFNKDLRRAVIFGRNDLVKDAPISRVDLLVCRNTLMYLNAETQRNVLGRLHFALAPQGTLFLGHAEMLLSHSDRFTPLEPEAPNLPQGRRARTAIWTATTRRAALV